MTSIVDSRAHLQKRCADMGMSARGVQQLGQNNLDTLGKIAFAVGQPGHPLDIAEFTRFVFDSRRDKNLISNF